MHLYIVTQFDYYSHHIIVMISFYCYCMYNNLYIMHHVITRVESVEFLLYISAKFLDTI